MLSNIRHTQGNKQTVPVNPPHVHLNSNTINTSSQFMHNNKSVNRFTLNHITSQA